MSGAWIVEVGARCPMGLSSLQVTTAARAGKREVREDGALLDKHHNPIGTCRARFLPDDLAGVDRLVHLGAPALREAARGLVGPAPLVLAAAEEGRPDAGPEIEAEIVARLAKAAGIDLDEPRSQVIRGGQAGFAEALEAALALLEKGAPAVIVGGVDSLVNRAAAAWLDAAHRLHAEGTEDGIIPAEGAAFLLLVPLGAVDARLFVPPAPAPLAKLCWVGTGRDDAAVLDEPSTLAEPLTALVQGALSSLEAPPSWVILDADELHRVREWMHVELRCHPAFEDARQDRVPDIFGDVGAATGAVAAAYACRGWALGGSPRGGLVVSLASDGARRGAFALEEVR